MTFMRKKMNVNAFVMNKIRSSCMIMHVVQNAGTVCSRSVVVALSAVQN